MNAISSTFRRLSLREQGLLAFSLWALLAVIFILLLGKGVKLWDDWSETSLLVESHKDILSSKKDIASAIDKKREEQRGVSYNLAALQNEVSGIMGKFFPPSQSRLKSDESESFKQHSQHYVRVELNNVSWADLKDFIKEFFLDERQRYIFFSEVEIDPDYKRNPEVYDATLHISSVEFK